MCLRVHARRDQLLQRYRKRETFLEVDLRVLSAYDLAMHDLLLKQPNEFIPVVRAPSPAHRTCFSCDLPIDCHCIGPRSWAKPCAWCSSMAKC